MTKPAPKLKRATATVPEAAAIIGIGRTTAYAAARETGFLDEAKTIPVLKFRGRFVVPVPALDRALGR